MGGMRKSPLLPHPGTASTKCVDCKYKSTGLTKHWSGDIAEPADALKQALEAISFRKELIFSVISEQFMAHGWG